MYHNQKSVHHFKRINCMKSRNAILLIWIFLFIYYLNICNLYSVHYFYYVTSYISPIIMHPLIIVFTVLFCSPPLTFVCTLIGVGCLWHKQQKKQRQFKLNLASLPAIDDENDEEYQRRWEHNCRQKNLPRFRLEPERV